MDILSNPNSIPMNTLDRIIKETSSSNDLKENTNINTNNNNNINNGSENTIYYQPNLNSLPSDQDNFDNTNYKIPTGSSDYFNLSSSQMMQIQQHQQRLQENNNNNNTNNNENNENNEATNTPNTPASPSTTDEFRTIHLRQIQERIQAETLSSNYTKFNIIYGSMGIVLVLATIILFIVGFMKQSQTIIFIGIVASPIGFVFINHSIHIAYRRSRRHIEMLQQQYRQIQDNAEQTVVDMANVPSKLQELSIDILSSPSMFEKKINQDSFYETENNSDYKPLDSTIASSFTTITDSCCITNAVSMASSISTLDDQSNVLYSQSQQSENYLIYSPKPTSSNNIETTAIDKHYQQSQQPHQSCA
ncbi:hypothetical protein CYY_008524 [Polysphondylium violaceum]|uniref:Transmembrane protein n=1 Tax=Polysphondylium violaceum TaxID=133409 RepID=A0A8J4PLJ6_9MYCE|nr:hypothetical protein CYY_008524 [Polysphondylium violaceum]